MLCFGNKVLFKGVFTNDLRQIRECVVVLYCCIKCIVVIRFYFQGVIHYFNDDYHSSLTTRSGR